MGRLGIRYVDIPAPARTAIWLVVLFTLNGELVLQFTHAHMCLLVSLFVRLFIWCIELHQKQDARSTGNVVVYHSLTTQTDTSRANAVLACCLGDATRAENKGVGDARRGPAHSEHTAPTRDPVQHHYYFRNARPYPTCFALSCWCRARIGRRRGWRCMVSRLTSPRRRASRPYSTRCVFLREFCGTMV